MVQSRMSFDDVVNGHAVVAVDERLVECDPDRDAVGEVREDDFSIVDEVVFEF